MVISNKSKGKPTHPANTCTSWLYDCSGPGDELVFSPHKANYLLNFCSLFFSHLFLWPICNTLPDKGWPWQWRANNWSEQKGKQTQGRKNVWIGGRYMSTSPPLCFGILNPIFSYVIRWFKSENNLFTNTQDNAMFLRLRVCSENSTNAKCLK